MTFRSRYPFAALLLATLLCGLILADHARAQRGGPAPVVTAPVVRGVIIPETAFVGSVYFNEISETAAEVPGIVSAYGFEVGDRVSAGQTLVTLDDDVVRAELNSQRALYEQALALQEDARVEYDRLAELFRRETISAQEYDSQRFVLESRRQEATSIKARVDRLAILKRKKTIPAPFDAMVLQRRVNIGDWVETGETVARLARLGHMDVVVETPQDVFEQAEPGREVVIEVGDRTLAGHIYARVLEGDISTRTFPLRIRLDNPAGLAQGMQAKAFLPTAERLETLVVPRDAVVASGGRDVVYTVRDDVARETPVRIVGYSGFEVGVEAPELEPGMAVVVKGNERLADGQPVAILTTENP
jgi:RND family efflux transporter MFP subunit